MAATVEPAVEGPESATPGRTHKRGRRLLVVALIALVAAGLGWRWMRSLPVPLEADNGRFGSAFEVGTEVHLGVFVEGTAGVSLSRAEPRLSSTSAPAAVGVSVCRLGQRGYIGSATGPLPPGTCESLTRFNGQRLGPQDYLIVTIVPLGAGTIDVELVATANDGIRTGTSRIDLSLVEAERS